MNIRLTLENFPVGHKMLLALMVLLIANLVAANLTLVGTTYWITRQSIAPQVINNLSSLLSMPEFSHDALRSAEAAENLLQRLQHYTPLHSAALYDTQGQQLAQRHNGSPLPLPKRLADVSAWQREEKHINQIVSLPQLEGPPGHLLLVASDKLPEGIHTGLMNISLAILGVSLLLWILVSRLIRHLITKPIRRLEKLTHRVTAEENYALRARTAPPQTRDEIGRLANALNTMLSRMEAREQQLRQAHDEVHAALERAEALTRETRHANQQLEEEVRMRCRIEKKLTGFQNYLNNIINSMPSALIAADENLHITQWNQQASLLSGTAPEDAQGQLLFEAFTALSPYEGAMRHAVQRQEVQKIERISWARHEAQHQYELTCYPLVAGDGLGVVVRIDDITERLGLEELMVQSEKMRSVGGLAAGMAHEINNPLGAVLHNVQNIRRRLSPELEKNQDTARELGLSLVTIDHYLQARQIPHMLDNAQQAASRAARIVNHMLGFTRMSRRQLTESYLPLLIDQALAIADHDFDLADGFDFRAIDIVRDFDNRLGPVPCIANELEQVLLNLLKNAAQAIHHGPNLEQGRIILRTRLNLPWAEIQVEDNGGGMPESTRRRIFEPFFTTKDVGQGTGLGLFVSYFIITSNHKGQMEVQSTPNQGSLFTLRLPLEPCANP